MEEAERLRMTVKDEIEEYQQKRHEMVLAKAKYEDKMSKNRVEMEQQIINEEVEKHIEIYKQHLEDEAQEKAQRELEEEMESEKEVLMKQFNEKMEDLHEDMERERVEHEKEVRVSFTIPFSHELVDCFCFLQDFFLKCLALYYN